MAEKITKRSDDYSRWYTDIVQQAELADYAPVKGCMVIRPYGYAIWEKMQAALDGMFKATGHRNAYFPLFIPESFMTREAEHVKGFAPECAVVTHGGGKKLDEPLYVRPTSETIIWSCFRKWIHSYRDLPLLINQWCNVVRWELRTRLFLRTTEFLWQEGHTAHATEEEAREETRRMLGVYRRFAEEFMAMPVIPGRKTDNEKFAGAVETYSIEAMMQDRRALQSGTSHYLGQNFARAFDVQYQTAAGALEYVYATSWGVSTRLIGALVMAHSDDQGLVLPPRLAPTPVVIVPIWKGDDARARVLETAVRLADEIRGRGIAVDIDDRDGFSPGWKFNEWEMRGVPLRLELGPRDLDKSQIVAVRRDSGEKAPIPLDGIGDRCAAMLEEIQSGLFSRARDFMEANTTDVEDYETLRSMYEGEGGGAGFARAHWCGKTECEIAVTDETKATIRNLPEDRPEEKGACIRCGEPSAGRVIFAKAY